MACITAIVTIFTASIVLTERSWELVLFALLLIALWSGYLLFSWSKPSALLLPVSILLCLIGFTLAGENLLTIERILGFQISNKLTLNSRLTDWANANAIYRTKTWEQFGDDPLFYRLQPGSVYRERYDYRTHDKEYQTIVDDQGFLNGDRSYYTRDRVIDMFIAGDSVMQGIGMPGVIEEIRPRVPFTVYSLSTASYSPRQKVEAQKLFALSKKPKWLVVEFYSGNDASEMIEDEICEKLKQDYRCRFDAAIMARGLSMDPAYASFGNYGDFGPLMNLAREVRSNSMTLALATGIAQKARRVIAPHGENETQIRLDAEAITLPGFTHYQIAPTRHLEWIQRGLRSTLQTYDTLVDAMGERNAQLLILYNPTSYEIYRNILPQLDIDPIADQISRTQVEALRGYASTKDLRFCDLTPAFQAAVRNGARKMFGLTDGTHWSPEGTKVAGKLITKCLKDFVEETTNH
jgi:hypothetical protein